MQRFAPVMILALGLASIGALFGLADATNVDWLRLVAFAMIPVMGLSMVAWRRARSKATRSSEEEGIEARIDRTARADAFRDLLVAASVILMLSFWLDQVAPWAWFALIMLIAVTDYWVRAALGRQQGA